MPKTEMPPQAEIHSYSAATDLGVQSHLDALRTIVGQVRGRDILDMGCGDGLMVRELAKLGANSSGVDPLLAFGGEPSLIRAHADSIPLPSASFDLVTFIFSLHHIPGKDLSSSLNEACRLLRGQGRLYVAEPLASGPFQYVIEPFHDETEVRKEAALALRREMPSRFGNSRVFHYTERRMFTGFEQFVDRMTAKAGFNRYRESDVRSPEVKRRFEGIFANSSGAFDQPVRVDFYF